MLRNSEFFFKYCTMFGIIQNLILQYLHDMILGPTRFTTGPLPLVISTNRITFFCSTRFPTLFEKTAYRHRLKLGSLMELYSGYCASLFYDHQIKNGQVMGKSQNYIYIYWKLYIFFTINWFYIIIAQEPHVPQALFWS